MSIANKWRKTDAALLVCFCTLASIFSLAIFRIDHPSSSSTELRRYLKAKSSRRARPQSRRRAKDQHSSASVYPWARNNLEPLTVTPEPSKETVLFWHIPKSGGTNLKAIYECLSQTIASKAGALPRFGHDEDEELVVFYPWENKRRKGPAYVNVDTTSNTGLNRAQELGLVPSGLADLIITSDPKSAIEHLYDDSHKGRALGLFRHPVDKLVSKFYYLQVATWERAYNPSWKNLSLLKWAEEKNNDNNHMVKHLAGKRMNAQVTEVDLDFAMETVSQRFIVGLTDKMEESVHRFNIVMGIDELDEDNNKCMDEFFGKVEEKKNSNSHPKVEKDDPAWKALAKKNALDVKLYDHILHLFEEQKEVIEAYTVSMAVQE